MLPRLMQRHDVIGDFCQLEKKFGQAVAYESEYPGLQARCRVGRRHWTVAELVANWREERHNMTQLAPCLDDLANVYALYALSLRSVEINDFHEILVRVGLRIFCFNSGKQFTNGDCGEILRNKHFQKLWYCLNRMVIFIMH